MTVYIFHKLKNTKYCRGRILLSLFQGETDLNEFIRTLSVCLIKLAWVSKNAIFIHFTGRSAETLKKLMYCFKSEFNNSTCQFLSSQVNRLYMT